MPGLGRIPPPDWEHLDRHPFTAVFEAKNTPPTPTSGSKQYYTPFLYDQGQTPECTGVSSAALMSATEYLKMNHQALAFDWNQIYWWANAHDGISGRHDGSTVRAAMDCLHQVGSRELVHPISGEPTNYVNKIQSYNWTQSFDDVIRYVFYESAVVFGTIWLDSMFNVDRNGWVIVDKTSNVAGGHAYLISGINLDGQWARLHNGWNGWGYKNSGEAFFHLDDLKWLLAQGGDGEAAAVVL